LRIRRSGQLRRADGLGRNILRGLDHLRSHRGKQLLRIRRSGQLRRTDDMERNNVRSANSWQLWSRDNVGCSHKHLHRFDYYLRRGHDLERNGLRGLDHLRSHCSKQLLRIRRSGQLRRADGLGRNILRGLDCLRSHRGK